MDLELELYGDVKEKTSGNAIGKVYINSLSSQPVDHEESTEGRQKVTKMQIPPSAIYYLIVNMIDFVVKPYNYRSSTILERAGRACRESGALF